MTKSELKRKTINGFFWGMIESVLSQGQGMIFGVILARLLSPHEFGLLGMIVVFTSIAQVFVDSGLTQALIRKQHCTNDDYSTVFWANISIGTFFYIILWFGAPFIAAFFEEPQLIHLTRVTGLLIIISSLTLIQQTILTKEVDFKTQTKISTLGTFIAGIISIALAFAGFSVWSLVWRNIINQAVRSILLWRHNRWMPKMHFHVKSFKELFGFGSNILFISIIAAAFKNAYNVIIGKTYYPSMVGNYTNADQYSMIPSSTLTNVTSKVSYPILVTLQDDDEKLKAGSGKIAHTVMYISFVVMFGLAAVASPLFLIVFGTKWQASIVFFQVLCVAYAISPMHTINQNIMKVKGRSDLFFRTEIIKYIVFVPFIILGIIFGLKVLITGIAFFYWISFAINAMYSRKLIGYSVFQQIAELIPIFLVSALPAFFVWFCSLFLPFGNIGLLTFQGIVYLGIVYALTLIFKIRAYYELKEIITRKLGYVSFINNFKKTL